MAWSEEPKAGKHSSTSSPNGLPYRMYCNLAEYFVPILMDVFNEMWHMKKVGESFQQGMIILLYQNGDPSLHQLVSNYD